MSISEKDCWKKIDACIARRDFRQAAEVIREILPRLTRREDRSDFWTLLAYCYRCLGAEERFTNVQSARNYNLEAKKYYLQAVRENPHDQRHRNTLARFYMEYESRPLRSLPFLTERVGDSDEPNTSPEEQERLALKGAALALTGRLDQALEHFHRAYDARFKQVVQSPDISPLEFALRRGAAFPREELRRVFDKISQFRNPDPKLLENIKARLDALRPR